MTQDRILPGILLMLAFCTLAPLLDAASKLATQTIPVGQITTARFVVQGVLMVPVALVMRISWRVPRRVLWLILLRAAFLIASTYGFVAGVRVDGDCRCAGHRVCRTVHPADPGPSDFRRPYRAAPDHRLAIGFAGCLLVIQPSLAAFGLVALFPLMSAFAFAAYMLVTRAISAQVHPVIQQLHTSIAGPPCACPSWCWPMVPACPRWTR